MWTQFVFTRVQMRWKNVYATINGDWKCRQNHMLQCIRGFMRHTITNEETFLDSVDLAANIIGCVAQNWQVSNGVWCPVRLMNGTSENKCAPFDAHFMIRDYQEITNKLSLRVKSVRFHYETFKLYLRMLCVL